MAENAKDALQSSANRAEEERLQDELDKALEEEEASKGEP